ncbi:hypothetical protein JCM11251_000905 [Rhodosporidiobolus azoricus]
MNSDLPQNAPPFFPIDEDWYIRLMHHVFILCAINPYYFSPGIVDDPAKLAASNEIALFQHPASLPVRDILREISGDVGLTRGVCEALEALEAMGCGPFQDLKP